MLSMISKNHLDKSLNPLKTLISKPAEIRIKSQECLKDKTPNHIASAVTSNNFKTISQIYTAIALT